MNTTKLKLTTPTDDELSAAVAEHVAGREWDEIAGKFWNFEADKTRGSFSLIPFATSADAVLPLLEKWGDFCVSRYGGEYIIELNRFEMLPDGREGDYVQHQGDDVKLPRAACIALLRANGIEVEVTP